MFAFFKCSVICPTLFSLNILHFPLTFNAYFLYYSPPNFSKRIVLGKFKVDAYEEWLRDVDVYLKDFQKRGK